MTDTKKTAARKAPANEDWVLPAHQLRSREQRDRLLKAGERIFARDGFWGAHVTQIAELASCSVGSFYRRFKDKEALFFALQEDMAGHARRNIEKVFDDPDWLIRPLDEMFEQLIRNTARTIVRIQGYYRALYEMSLRGHQVWAPMRLLEEYQAERIAQMLAARGVKTDHPDFALAAATITRMINSLIISSVIHNTGPHKADDPAFHREMTMLLMRYLGIREASRRR